MNKKNTKKKHFNERTVPSISIGDIRYISWTGKDVVAVKVISVSENDDPHCAHAHVEHLDGKRKGSVSSLFWDEIRSSPDEAKENYITF